MFGCVQWKFRWRSSTYVKLSYQTKKNCYLLCWWQNGFGVLADSSRTANGVKLYCSKIAVWNKSNFWTISSNSYRNLFKGAGFILYIEIRFKKYICYFIHALIICLYLKINDYWRNAYRTIRYDYEMLLLALYVQK